MIHPNLLKRQADRDRLTAAPEVWPLFERKARQRGVDPARFAERFLDREARWARRWDDELAEYVTGDVPHFDGVLRAVRRELRFALR